MAFENDAMADRSARYRSLIRQEGVMPWGDGMVLHKVATLATITPCKP